MPVEDHPVHPSTQHAVPISGCNSRNPMHDSYGTLIRDFTQGVPRGLRPWRVPHKMSTLCRQIHYATLPECRGCQAPKDMTYITEKLKLLYPDATAPTKPI